MQDSISETQLMFGFQVATVSLLLLVNLVVAM